MMRPWVSPYCCRRGPSANTTANRGPSCATPREGTPSARPTTPAPVNASLSRWRARSNGPPAANPAAPPLAPPATLAGRPPEGGQLRPAPAPGDPAAFQPSPARSAGGGRGPRVDLPPPRGEAQPAGCNPAPPPAQGRPPPGPEGELATAAFGRRWFPPTVVGAALSPHDRGQGRSAPGATEGSPSDGPGSQARASPCPRKTRQTGQTDRQRAWGPKGQGKAQAVPWPAKEDVAERPRWAGRPPANPARSLRPGGGTGERTARETRGRRRRRHTAGQGRRSAPAARAPTPARSATREHPHPTASPYSWRRRPAANTTSDRAFHPRRHGGKDRAGDAPPPPPPHSRPRAALGSGGPRSHPRPLRHPRTPAPDRLSLQLAAQARSQHDQRQGLPSAAARGKGPSGRRAAAAAAATQQAKGGARLRRPALPAPPGSPLRHPRTPHPTASPYSWRRRPAANTTRDRAFHPSGRNGSLAGARGTPPGRS
ncbi:hypothetical protein C7M84_025149 [Penaeus vannamei]|uniref:Uncharacterized protein n=1 Tax=Penaeus vannamei TaxID=6689 RepID=A0A423TZ14_PENVA|nr:hypothetical protein C7M84_025149 [Penaeus vannamei]